MSNGGWLKEARRRRVFRTAGVYIVGAWVVVQIALAVFPALSIAESAVRYVWIAALLGFPFAALFGWRYDIRDGSIVRTLPGDSRASLGLERADYLILSAIALMAIAILAGSVLEIGDMEPQEDVMPASVDIDPSTVAVLPFTSMSADPENEYFSDGLTETLLHMLTQLDDLKVAARTSSFAFKETSKDIRSIASALGVAHVLEGSVQKAGNRVRVTAQLIRADDGFHLWSQNYDRELVDIFSIQDEIAGDVASALGSTLLTSPEQGIRSIETADFNAFDLYLQALEQQNINSSEALDGAERLFEAALEEDPGFIDAKLGLARNYIWKRWKHHEDGAAHFDKATRLIQDIRSQQPQNVDAQVMELLVQSYRAWEDSTSWGADEPGAQLIDEMLSIAMQHRVDSFLTSNIVDLVSGYPWRRDEEALELLRRALEEDPLNIELLQTQSRVFQIAERPEEARQSLLTARQLAPRNPEIPSALGFLAFGEDRYAEGLKWFREAHRLDAANAQPMVVMAMALYQLGFLEEGDHWRSKIEALEGADCRSKELEVVALDRASGHQRLLEITSRDLVQVLDNPMFCYHPIDYYVWTMVEEDRAQEALDYLGSLDPRILVFDKVIEDNRRTQYLQAMAAWLSGLVMEPEAFRAMYDSYMEKIFALYPDWVDMAGPNYQITHYTFTGQHEQAMEVLLDWYPKLAGIGGYWRWRQLLNYPWLEEFRSDPEAAAFIAQHHQHQAVMRSEVAELLAQPEWQEYLGSE